MHQVITISREFGSGGREFGRRLAEELQIAYYDHEIILELAKNTPYTEAYLKRIEEKKPLPLLPITIGRSLSPLMNPHHEPYLEIFTQQRDILRKMARNAPCVIVGRCGDYILEDYQPLRLFVYADLDFKLARCRHKRGEQAGLSDKELQRQIRSVDKERAKYYQYYTGQSWGEKANYDLCLNTASLGIKKAALWVGDLIRNKP